MRALVISAQVPADQRVSTHVQLRSDWPEPTVGAMPPGSALIRTLATALNHLDIWVGHGVPGLKLTYPRISGCDACGEILAVSPDVDPAWIGKRVILNAASDNSPLPGPTDPPSTTMSPAFELIGEHHHGAMAEKFVAPIHNLAVVSDGSDPVEAAAFGLTFLTAFSMMITKAGLCPGQTVLITGIGGGVALAALSIANWLGCTTVVTSRHQWKLERATSLGATHTILDSGQDWSREVRAATKGRGVDLAVDSSGKATHLKCIKSLTRGGAYVTPGCTSGADATTDLARIFWNQLRILGSTMGSVDEFQEIAALYRTGKFKPVVDRVFSPDQGPQAYDRIESAEQFGKVVVRWG